MRTGRNSNSRNKKISSLDDNFIVLGRGRVGIVLALDDYIIVHGRQYCRPKIGRTSGRRTYPPPWVPRQVARAWRGGGAGVLQSSTIHFVFFIYGWVCIKGVLSNLVNVSTAELYKRLKSRKWNERTPSGINIYVISRGEEKWNPWIIKHESRPGCH